MDFDKFVQLDFKDILHHHTKNLFEMIPENCLQMFIAYMCENDISKSKKVEISKQIALNVKQSHDPVEVVEEEEEEEKFVV